MSNFDGEPNEVQQPEVVELPPNPETAETREDFQDRLEANKEHIVDGMRSDDDWNEQASAIAANYSPDEIKEKMEALGDQNEIAQQYEDAVFGEVGKDFDSEAEKEQAIAEAGDAWSSSVEKNEVYSMALEKFDTNDESSGSETPEATEDVTWDDVGVDEVEPPRIPDGDEGTDQNEPVDHYHGFERGGREMTSEEKEAYNISPEVEDFVATGKDFDVLLPSQMESEGNGESVETEAADGQSEVEDDAPETSEIVDDAQEQIDGQDLESKQDGFWEFFGQGDEPEAAPESESTDGNPDGDSVGNAEEQLPNDEYKIEVDEDGHIVQKEEELRFGIGHDELADIEAYRDSKSGERIAESMQDNYTADGVGDAYKNIHETNTDLDANDEMADKMREYTISQGHDADYVDDYGSIKR